jgi:hypothetical protein
MVGNRERKVCESQIGTTESPGSPWNSSSILALKSCWIRCCRLTIRSSGPLRRSAVTSCGGVSSGRLTQALGAGLSTFGLWEFTVDREATVAAYALADRGGSDQCSCNGCRNFSVARNAVYPAAFLALLESLGIDSLKDGEVFHNARLGPGVHDYGGWFHFIGSLHRTGDFPVVDLTKDFQVWFLQASAPPLASLKGHHLVQVEFHATTVPWVLNEREAGT